MTSSEKTPSKSGMSWLRRFLPRRWRETGPIVPVLRFSGPIGMATPLRPGLSLATTAPLIERAFTMKGAKAVCLLVNSPGGSPVQSRQIFERVRALADEKELPVYVFAEDVAASGGYMLAVAGDEIFADPSSIIGSIGVVSAGFGFNQMIEKIGVERRVHTSGENKYALDPFQPESPSDIAHLKSIQEDVHETFIDLVKERRGKKLDADSKDVFSGLFWSGKQALALGLIDGLADIRSTMREKLGDDVQLKLISPPRSLFRRGGNGVFGALQQTGQGHGFRLPTLADDFVSAIEARALWSRFGL